MNQVAGHSAEYADAVARLQARGRFGIRLGLGRTRALLRRLGNPERGVRGVLVGGTNGKGSVQALVAAALRDSGQRVGQTPKPHLVDYRERIVVDGQPIAPVAFALLVDEVLAAADEVPSRLGPPTEFEVLTSAAFLHFARAGVDVAVVEVGMGGRLDATNAWQGGVSAITNVALDHTEYLGPTVVAIAREKAQIIKRGDAAALTGAEGQALAVIARRARRVDVPLRAVEPLTVRGMDRHGLHVDLPGGEPLTIGLLGRHQAANAALALGILHALGAAGIGQVAPAATRRAFAAARWPGRLELIERPGWPQVLLDGAHNAAGAAALAAALDELGPHLAGGRPAVLIGVLRDKDVRAMVASLRSTRLLSDAAVVTTVVPDAPRSLGAAELAAAWGRAVRPIPDLTGALAEAAELALTSGGPLVVCGSLYLVGHIRRLVFES